MRWSLSTHWPDVKTTFRSTFLKNNYQTASLNSRISPVFVTVFPKSCATIQLTFFFYGNGFKMLLKVK